MIQIDKTQKGFALVVSLLLLLLMTVMGIAMTGRSNLNTNMSIEYDRAEHVLLAAEAGIEHARRYLENSASNNIYPPNTIGPLTAAPLNGCLSNYADGIGSAVQQYDTLSFDSNNAPSGRYAYAFPPIQNGEFIQPLDTCITINANPNAEINYRRMDCELGAAIAGNAARINFYRTYGFSYFLIYEGEASGAGTSPTGTGVAGTSTEYSAGSQSTTYYYKVISCGAGFDWLNPNNNRATLRQIETIEARIKLGN